MRNSIRQAGFTLLEIVVAVSIFGVIAAIIFPALLQFLEMRERVDERHQQVESLQKTFLFLANDLRYAANRLSKDEYGDAGKTTLSLNDDHLMEFVVAYPDLTLSGLAVPRRVLWRLEEGRLQRIQYPVMDPDSQTRRIVQNLLADVDEVDIEVSIIEETRDKTADTWEEVNRLPDLITIEIGLEEGQRFRRSFNMQGGDTLRALAATRGAQGGSSADGNAGESPAEDVENFGGGG